MSKQDIPIIPLYDRVVIRFPKKTEVTDSGIFLPESAQKERTKEGVVVAVGDGRVDDNGKRVPVSVAIGDTVIFSEYAGEEVEIDGGTYLIVDESAVKAKIIR